MGGGKVSQTQQADGTVTFRPFVAGGGDIMIGGSVGNGDVIQGSQGQASGASANLGLSMPLMPGGLMNLQNQE